MPESSKPSSDVDAGFSKMGLNSAQRHLFLCVGPDCCAPERGLEVWEYLKSAVKTHQLPAMRTKAGCFRICTGGPWLVVYPEGVWYGAVTVERCERIVREHLVGGRVVEEWVARTHPLPGPAEDHLDQ